MIQTEGLSGDQPSLDDPSREALLEVRDLAVAFGSGKQMAHAVRGVSFQVRPGRRLGSWASLAAASRSRLSR